MGHTVQLATEASAARQTWHRGDHQDVDFTAMYFITPLIMRVPGAVYLTALGAPAWVH